MVPQNDGQSPGCQLYKATNLGVGNWTKFSVETDFIEIKQANQFTQTDKCLTQVQACLNK